MAGPNVTTTIRLEGEDRASAKIDAVRHALGGAGKAAQDAAHRTEAVAEKAGDLERGFIGVRDVIGNLGSQELQALTDRFGGIEAIIKGFGPKFGVIGLAITGIGAAAAYWYEQTEKTRKAAIDLQIEAIKNSKDDLEVQAKRLGVSAELLGHKQAEKTVEAAIATAKEHANKSDEYRVKLLEAQRDKETEKIAGLQTEISNLQTALLLDQRRLDIAKQLAAEANLAAGLRVREQTRDLVEQARINGILDQRERLQAQALDVQSKRRVIEASQLRLQDEIRQGTGDRLEQEKQLQSLVKQRLELDSRERQIASEGQARADARAAKAAAAHQAAAAKRKAAAAEALAFEKDLDEQREDIARRAVEMANAAFLAEQSRMKARRESERRWRDWRDAVVTDPTEKFNREIGKLDEELAGRMREANEDRALSEDDLQTKIMEIEAEGIARRKALEDKRKSDEDKANDDRIRSAFAVARNIESALEQEGLAQRDAAKLKAAIAAAEAVYAIVKQDYVGAVAAGIAAAQFSAIAFGTSGGSTGAGTASVASAGMAEGGGSSRAPSSGGGGGNVIINYNKGFYGSPQENAKGIAGTLRSLGTTGQAAFKGA
jgi:DNA repair exonuclease SbcCD ATPase subunit